MSALTGKELRNRWIANAEGLERNGYFATYSPEQRGEVLRKGFLGRYPPDQAIRLAREQAERGFGYRKGKFNDNMREYFGLVGDEVREKLLEILDEVPPECYRPPYELNEPPGCPFIFRSRVLGREVFFQVPDHGYGQEAPRALLVLPSSHLRKREKTIMKCFQCEKGNMVSQLTEMTAHVRGEDAPVRTEAMVCIRCGLKVLTDEQSNAYTIASADAYREKHGLLTTRELKEIRERLRMSFRSFAKYLRVSEASPKRWEAGLVQDEAMDELIRVKTDPVTARKNVKDLDARLGLISTGSREQVIVLQMPRRELAESEWRVRGESISIGGVRYAPGFMRDTCYGA
jgi:putative zinc finger/helix-turn-helix YgiT family protein